MELSKAVELMLKIEASLREPGVVSNPVRLSIRMTKLSQYISAVEEHLAEYEKDLEVTYAVKLKEYLIDNNLKVTEAQRLVEIDTAKNKGQVKYLTRLVGSGWKQVSVIQSRINHLVKESGTQI